MNMLYHSDESSSFYTDERCFVIEILNAPNEANSIAQIKVLPGVTTALHRLIDVQENYYILSGNGVMEVEGLQIGEVAAGDVVCIPAGKTQRIHNTGELELIFLAICYPRFTPDCYEHLE